MRRAATLLAALSLFAFGPLPLGGGGTAEAACQGRRDAAGNVRVRCDDGTTGTLRDNGTGGLSGRVGNRQIRGVDGGTVRRQSEDSVRGAARSGSRGDGGLRNNSRSSGSNCMSGGLRVNDCN
ncbi:hypothetical protein [Aureimonas psammosilenae]|uniref:hypothetical protein n=1 Tax=Aureimonas psammosilenae TaxID=2495496 RepID=UPI0012607C7D|nr:hypothetical protein [Aureimonas psammosilenae]